MCTHIRCLNYQLFAHPVKLIGRKFYCLVVVRYAKIIYLALKYVLVRFVYKRVKIVNFYVRNGITLPNIKPTNLNVVIVCRCALQSVPNNGVKFYSTVLSHSCAFSALTLLVGRQEGHPAYKKTEWWGAGVVVCLEQGADLHMAQLIPLPLTVSCFSKIQIGLPFWYRLTRVVLEKGPLNGCVCVCVCSKS